MQDKLFTSFHGRIPRAQWWLGSVLIFLSQVLLITLVQMAGGKVELVEGYISLLTLIPHLAIHIKRCHDRDRSGWFMLLMLIPLVNLWYIVEVGFLPGTKGDNRFGPDPLADKQHAAVYQTSQAQMPIQSHTESVLRRSATPVEPSRVKETAGYAIAGFAYVALSILGTVIHIWTIVISYTISGLIAAILSLALPVLAQIYWFFFVWSANGTLMNKYCLALLVYLALWAIVGIGASLAGSRR